MNNRRSSHGNIILHKYCPYSRTWIVENEAIRKRDTVDCWDRLTLFITNSHLMVALPIYRLPFNMFRNFSSSHDKIEMLLPANIWLTIYSSSECKVECISSDIYLFIVLYLRAVADCNFMRNEARQSWA